MKRQLVMGLPGSGKTTFLAALWALLNSADAVTEMRLKRLPPDWSHFQSLAALWLDGQELPRTSLQAERWVRIDLVASDDAPGTVFSLPDLSGESFEAQWRDRSCGKDYLDAVTDADSMLLFVHSTDIRRPLNLTTMLAAANALWSAPETGRGDVAETSRSSPNVAETAWNPDRSPTQVMLVDLLQILLRQPFAPKRRRLAVVLSAWDLVIERVSMAPAHYLAAEFPLLDQFLQANDDAFQVKVFGISPQGGDKADPGFFDRVGKYPQERIIVDDGDRRGYDLTAPLAWASGYG